MREKKLNNAASCTSPTKCLLDGQTRVMVTAGLCPLHISGGVEVALTSYCNLSLKRKTEKVR